MLIIVKRHVGITQSVLVIIGMRGHRSESMGKGAAAHHEHVGALGGVELGLDERLARVGRVHLVRLLVARRARRGSWRRVQSIAEGACRQPQSVRS